MQMFCPKCKALLMPSVQNGKRVLKCGNCGYLQVGEMKLTSSGTPPKEVAVVDKEVDVRVQVETTCPKCKHGKARHWAIQTRSADEPETRYYQCEACGHTWREYK